MSAVDPWPQAPMLADLPPTAQLALRFDPARLQAELRQLQAIRWNDIRVVSGDGLGDYATALDWRAIPLRSIGGDGDRGDAGGPGLRDFADTPWLARLPYLAEVLAAIPSSIASARLMALGPGARTPMHSDTKVGLPWGTVRLHVPIIVVPEATLTIVDECHCWPQGTVWYADFTRGHRVENSGSRTRVHLVIDACVTPRLLALFPAAFRAPAAQQGSLFEPPPAELDNDRLDTLRCAFDMPESFCDWEAPDETFLHDRRMARTVVDRYENGLALYLGGEPVFGLVHIGGDEFRFAGWTAERTVQISPGATEVALRTRVGRDVRTLRVQADVAAGSAQR
jgi:hypothetical protein